jgi:hypothetical protein
MPSFSLILHIEVRIVSKELRPSNKGGSALEMLVCEMELKELWNSVLEFGIIQNAEESDGWFGRVNGGFSNSGVRAHI